MARKIAYSAMLVALGMIFSYIEFLIPFHFGVPGIKLGLANLVVILGIYFLEPTQVALVLVTRIILSAFMFGGISTLAYSMAGGISSFCVMLLLKKRTQLSMTGVSIAGGISHNVGQLCVAACVLENRNLFLYLPVLLIAGMTAGFLIGVIGNSTISKIQRGV